MQSDTSFFRAVDMVLASLAPASSAAASSSVPASAPVTALTPLPDCPDHPTKALELFCKACRKPVCFSCVKHKHAACQQKWDGEHAGSR